MSTRLLRTILTVLMMLGGAAAGHAAWIGPDGAAPEAPAIAVSEAGVGRTVIDIEVPGLAAETIEIDGKAHTKLVLPGHVQLLERGAPQLPYITTSLIIPDQGTPQVRVVKSQYREYAIDPVAPSKGSILRTVDPATVPYEFGPAYQGGVFPAEIASVSEPYIVRDYRGVNVRLFPAQWDADRGLLRVLTSVTLEVVTEGSGGVNAKTTGFGQVSRTFDALYAQQFANYDGAAKYVINGGEGPMLIVCYDAFVSAMQPFIQWKTERGIPVEMITTSSVGGTVSGIQAAIQQRYDSAAGLAFVVLVGDGAQVPHYSGAYEGANDDTRYMRLNGTDVYPDALISRISATTPTDVSTQTTKFIQYERDIAGAADWTHMATGIASNEGSPTDAERANWLRTDLLAYNFTDVDQIYQGQGGTTSGITNAVNAGRSLVNYIGHGSGTSWSSVYYSNTDVAGLTNTAWPWIIDVSCLNGGISAIGTSFAEAWMRAGSPAQPYGAVGMYSSSTSTPWVPPCVMQAEAVDLLCAETSNVIGVLCQAGIMEVVDVYGTSGEGLQLIEQYNLFGDCSLVVRTASPQTMTVAHQPVVPLFAPTFSVNAGVAGAVATLSGGGVIYGTGTTDASGNVDLVMQNDIDTIGDLTLTVFGYNLETYQATLQAVVPANISIVPATVPVGQTTSVTVTVTDPDTGGGMAGILVDVVGYGFNASAVQTDAAGQVVMDVTPLYGEGLTIRGQEIGADYYMFSELLTVTGAMALGQPTVTAGVPSIGMDGTLTPHIEGEITATARNAEFTLFLRGGGLDLQLETTGTELMTAATPTELSPVTATIAKPGFSIFQQDIDVVAAFGTLAGTVTDADNGGAALPDARVYGFPQGADPSGTPLFDVTTNALGAYTVADELAVGYYDIYVSKFGYMPYQETYFLLYGANDHGIAVAQAPAGVLSGVITGSDNGLPLDGAVRVYRSDNDQLMGEFATNPATGYYESGGLPYFSYRVVARASGRIPQTVTVAIDAAVVTRDFQLDPTEGDILLLDDASTLAMNAPAKYDPETGELLAPAYEQPATRAAADIVADLEALGYTVTVEAAATSNPALWQDYDMLICSSGANLSPLSSSTLRANLTTFRAAGGKLLVEGGEIAYDLYYGDATFLANVLHVSSWGGDSSGNVSVAVPEHAVMSVPNTITGPITNSYSGYGDADRATVTGGAVMVGNWTSYTTQASVIAYDDDDTTFGGQFAFFLFNYSAMGAGRAELLHNTVNWLLTDYIDTTPVEDVVVPRSLELTGNYPNPFNPMTVISFALPAGQDVQLAVFDVRGQRVRTLVDEALPAGFHEVTWQGRDDGGRTVSSGIYFYRLIAGGESRVAKMTLLK
jgi:hypothetical protein